VVKVTGGGVGLPMERLSREGQLLAYRHTDFWQGMDTLRAKGLLEPLWQKRRRTLEHLEGLRRSR
jgi:hypothetical protein